MIYKVLAVEQIGDSYHLKITFNNWVVKDFDCEPYVWWDSYVFWPLKNKHTFKLFNVIDGTIVWDTWADFCPNVLFEKWI